MIPVFEPKLFGNEEKYVLDCLRSNWISSSGPYLNKLEEKFSKYIGVNYGQTCTSGSVALQLALEALDVKGGEVIIPDFTIIVCATSAINAGAKPVLVDVDKKTWCIDVSKIEEKITKKTKSIMPVHMYGHPCDMDPIMELSKKYNLHVVEDCCQTHGTEYKGKKVGSFGDVNAFSFYANKAITCGEGGMTVTNNEELAERVKLLRNVGFTEPRFLHYVKGFNYRMTNIQAAIALAQLENIDKIVGIKRIIAKKYNKLLEDYVEDGWFTLPYEAEWAKNNYWMYSILINDSFGLSRDEVMVKLKENGVDTRSFFYPMHQQPLFKNNKDRLYPNVKGKYPVSDYISKRGLYLPSGLTLIDDQIKEVVDKLVSLKKK